MPLLALLSTEDTADADDILFVHQSRPAVRRVRAGCGEDHPGPDALWARLVKVITPEDAA
jgi:hypothetical protein